MKSPRTSNSFTLLSSGCPFSGCVWNANLLSPSRLFTVMAPSVIGILPRVLKILRSQGSHSLSCVISITLRFTWQSPKPGRNAHLTAWFILSPTQAAAQKNPLFRDSRWDLQCPPDASGREPHFLTGLRGPRVFCVPLFPPWHFANVL